MDTTHYFTLPNGIRVVHRPVSNTRILHCGIVLDIGSRDEQPHQYGIAHFWEHMAFKGTRRRKAYHIINSLDSVGGELNAYTTKEKICFYASVLDHFDEKAVELLSDITFNSIFPQKQLDKERQVILEEMAMYRDNPEDAIQDDFDELVFNGHDLAHNILGTGGNIQRFTRQDFMRFIEENIDTKRIVISFVGNLPLKRIKKLTEKHFGHIAPRTNPRQRQPLQSYTPARKEQKKPILQAHFAIGQPAIPVNHPQRIPFSMLVNLLGGPGMNSRLNLALRERLGYVYSVEAQYHSYTDTGLFAVVFGTEQKNLKRSINVVKREIRKVQTTRLGRLQLHTLKEQMMGHLAMAAENNLTLMMSQAKSLLDQERLFTLDELFDSIKQVTAGQLLELANELLDINQMSSLTYLPQKNGVHSA